MSTALHWQRLGAGEPLLLLHGIGSTRDDFGLVHEAVQQAARHADRRADRQAVTPS